MKKKQYISAEYAARQKRFAKLPVAKVMHPLRGLKNDIIAAARGLAFLDPRNSNVQYARYYLQQAITRYRLATTEPVYKHRLGSWAEAVRHYLNQVLQSLQRPATA